MISRCFKPEKLVAILEEMFVAGEPLTDAKLEQMAAHSGVSERGIFWYAWHYVIRDMSARWLCELADELGMTVEVYGRGWERDPLVSPFFKGTLPHGPAVAKVYNTALYSLVPHPFDLQSQRLTETAACGSIPIVYDCRYRAEKPHWDENCLWYRTKADLRACLLAPSPPMDVRIISQGGSYGDFVQQILSDTVSLLSGKKASIYMQSPGS